MRLRTAKNGLTVNVVAGTSAILFSFDMKENDAKDLLGFYIHKDNLTTGTGYDVSSTRYFASTVENPAPGKKYSTKDHPWQSFLWEDFYVKKGGKYRYTFTSVHGTPANKKYKKKLSIDIAVPSSKESVHEVHFNRGVAGSQAYALEFNNERPDKMPPEKAAKALKWLSNGLEEAMIAFIKQAKNNSYRLRCCFYEFEYETIAEALKDAAKKGVDVKVIYDARKEAAKNEAAIALNKIPKKLLIPRKSNPNYIQHNKFMVLLKNDAPVSVWTGSTNITAKGIFGQCNTGHIVRDKKIAEKYLAYWNCLKSDPDNPATRTGSLNIQEDVGDFAEGITVFFSPRSKTALLGLYGKAVESSTQLVCGMFPFSFNTKIKDAIKAQTDFLKYIIIDKKADLTTLSSDDIDNVIVYGTALDTPLYNWLQETNAGSLFKSGTNYIHNKLLLIDPLSDSPLVIVGSANFSDNSILRNDENTLVIKGDKNLADLYFTEFSRIFNHYSTRNDIKKLTPNNERTGHNPNHLWEKPAEWVPSFYKKTALKYKRKLLFNNMTAENIPG